MRALLLTLLGCGRIGFDDATAEDSLGVPGLVAFYPFEATSDTTFADATGHGHTAVCTSDVCLGATVNGRVGSAAAFTGVERYEVTSVAALETPDAFTVAAWMLVKEVPTTDDFACAATKVWSLAQQNSWTLCIDVGRSVFFATVDTTGSTQGDYAGTLALETWHHVAIRWDGQMKTLWIGGALVLERPAVAALFDGHAISIGLDRDFGVASQPFVGQLDELRIYDRALDVGEIMMLAQ